VRAAARPVAASQASAPPAAPPSARPPRAAAARRAVDGIGAAGGGWMAGRERARPTYPGPARAASGVAQGAPIDLVELRRHVAGQPRAQPCVQPHGRAASGRTGARLWGTTDVQPSLDCGAGGAVPAMLSRPPAGVGGPPRLWTLGSGSKGNAAVLAHGGHHLMFDCGYELPVLVDRLRAAGLHPWDIDDVVLTHGHRDHVVGAAAGARAYGWRVWAALGTVWRWRALREIALHPFEPGATVDAGPWRLHTTPVPHDVDDAAAFVAEWTGSGPALRVGYATDFGRAPDALVDLLRGASAFVLESNHDEAMLRTGPYPPERQARVGGEHGHLSNRQAADVLRAVAHPGLRHVVLGHVSQHNNTPELALAVAHAALAGTGFRGEVHVAPQHAVLGPLVVGDPADGVTSTSTAELTASVGRA